MARPTRTLRQSTFLDKCIRYSIAWEQRKRYNLDVKVRKSDWEARMISPSAEYALRAIVALAQRQGRSVVTPDLAKVTRISAPYLSKILQTLGRAGLVLSQRGTGGGFRLARTPDSISVLEVINAVDPVKRIHSCPLGIESHGTRLCPLHRRLDDVAEQTERTFSETTIAELLREDGPSKALCASKKDRVTLTGRPPAPAKSARPRNPRKTK